MTRKCVMCQETNYKTKYSFFSAPKDAETRKKWKDAIGNPEYTVCDETYVCSKHFSDRDIISHWASGTPPHVVTIKYKKCRLRPGAVPTASKNRKKYNVSTKKKKNQQDDEEEEEDEDEIMERKTDDEEEHDFEVNKDFETRKPTTITRNNKNKSFQIPRTYVNSDNNKLKLNNQSSIEFHDLKNGIITSQRGDNCEEEMIISEQLDNNLDDDDDDNDNEDGEERAFYINTGDCQQLYYIKTIDENSKTNFTEDDAVNDDNSKEITVETNPLIDDENIDYNNVESYEYHSQGGDDDDDDEIIEEIEQDIDDGDNMAIWEHIKTEKNNLLSKNNEDNGETMETCTSTDPLELNDAYDDEEVMLFEDLLDNYTEVMLPKGWSSLVESRGNDTSIIYAFMKTSMNGIPWIQKQVFIQSDMLMRCSAAGKELNPKIHNLIKEKKRVKVHNVDDVTDLLREFDSRTICQGTSEKINPADMDNTIGYLDGVNWRHVECSIMIKPGQARCKKCNSLNAIAKRKKAKLP
ncbi:hypothetical protein HCN44_002970 [Aphidius gifuensis]|uniref:THAP-type domain-containing protein n=1 Tax=Aphidius gifuensis TaxID=684658 RepID=A0A834XQ81_APHGI|nr:hypothetical protein HCN44_002970 [Aphidius gifuensis]